MLDLERLEKLVDEALSNETSETLLKWIENKRNELSSVFSQQSEKECFSFSNSRITDNNEPPESLNSAA
ncbi:hypothetical protein Barb6_01744 [Bacteroidales bacterium Barb6]|nr:hypothetical protein Barb6_01744 [Bacteroidales bacterium Barb6]